jgi:hypothetical protein
MRSRPTSTRFQSRTVCCHSHEHRTAVKDILRAPVMKKSEIALIAKGVLLQNPRSRAGSELIAFSRAEEFGQRLLNLDHCPHASGRSRSAKPRSI